MFSGRVRKFYVSTLFQSKKKSFYEILGVNQKANNQEIKEAYIKLVKRYHPDQNSDPQAEEIFKEVGKAYETLKDPIKRQLYDFGSSNE